MAKYWKKNSYIWYIDRFFGGKSGFNILNFFRQFLGGVGEDFRQGGMVMRNLQKVVHCSAKMHVGDQLMDQFPGFGSDDVPANDFSGLRIAKYLSVTVGFPETHRFTVIAERVRRGEIRNIFYLAFLFAQTDAGDSRIGEHDTGFQPIVEFSRRPVFMHGIVRGYLSLLDGDRFYGQSQCLSVERQQRGLRCVQSGAIGAGADGGGGVCRGWDSGQLRFARGGFDAGDAGD